MVGPSLEIGTSLEVPRFPLRLAHEIFGSPWMRFFSCYVPTQLGSSTKTTQHDILDEKISALKLQAEERQH